EDRAAARSKGGKSPRCDPLLASPLLQAWPPPPRRQSTSRSPRLYDRPAPPISRWDEDGFSSCSACPCHRAAPNHPAEVASRLGQPAACHAAFAPDQRARPSESFFFEATPGFTDVTARGLAHHPQDGVVARLHPRRVLGGCDRSYGGVCLLPSVGLTPTEHASLSWTHWSAKSPRGSISRSTNRSRRECCAASWRSRAFTFSTPASAKAIGVVSDGVAPRPASTNTATLFTGAKVSATRHAKIRREKLSITACR